MMRRDSNPASHFGLPDFRRRLRVSRVLSSIILAFALAFLVAALACTRRQPVSSAKEDVDPLNRADATRMEPIHFLHKTFSVKKYTPFNFEVPPHAAIPHLHGTFRAFVSQPGQDPLSDDTTNVDFLLLNGDQYDDFVHGRGDGTALHSTEPTHDHEVDFILPPSHDAPEKYYVVFRNSPGGAVVKSVQADFTLSFGY